MSVVVLGLIGALWSQFDLTPLIFLWILAYNFLSNDQIVLGTNHSLVMMKVVLVPRKFSILSQYDYLQLKNGAELSFPKLVHFS